MRLDFWRVNLKISFGMVARKFHSIFGGGGMTNIISHTVLGDIPSLKNTLRVGRSGQFYHADDKVKLYKRDFLSQTPARMRQKLEGSVRVDLVIYQKDRRRDGHNAEAIVFDALEYAGVIKNDRQIVEWEGRSFVDKNCPRVEVKVEQL